jgi:hypothetical protein
MQKRLLSIVAITMAAAAAIAQSVKDFAVDLAYGVHDGITRLMQDQGLMLGLITSSKKEAASLARGPMSYSHFDDAAVPAAFVLTPGFKPRYVCIDNVTDRIKYEWYDGMAKTDYIKTVAAGARTIATDSALSVDVSDGVQPTITLAASQVLQNKQYRAYAL